MFGWQKRARGEKGTTRVWQGLALCVLAAFGCASDPGPSDRSPDQGAAGSTNMMLPSTGSSGASGSENKPLAGSPSSSGSSGMAGGSMTLAGASGGMSSGTSGSMSTGGAMVDCSALALPSDADDVISTFEDGMGNVNQSAGRGGGFYMFNDGSGMQMPPPGMLPPARKEMRCDSMFALCMSGKGFTVWGAGMGTDLGPTGSADGGVGSKNPYDASMYKGIQFWAKANAGSATAVRVGFKDANTAPEGGNCDATMDSGPEACNDDWGKNINFTTSWAPYTILWTELKQAGWGKATTSYDVANAYSIQFQVNKGLDFDLCIDDLAFVR